MNIEAAVAFVQRSKHQVDHARGKINHCLDQLQDEDLWWTPREGCNSIGVIVQHLMGNLRQWAICGVGGEVDTRDRPREFRVEQRTPKAELQAAFSNLLDQVNDTYSNVRAPELLESRRIQAFDTTVLNAIYDTMCHLELHAGQVLYLTRLRLGEAYKESWTPPSKEHGA